MLPEKVINGARSLLRRRVARIARMLNFEGDKAPNYLLAMQAKLIGEVAWLLAPEAIADSIAADRAIRARRMFRVCVWDGECEADATTDDGLCAAHAEQQAKEDAEVDPEFDAMIAELARPSDS